MSFTSNFDKYSNETVIYAGYGAIENVEEKVEVSSRHSAKHGSRKKAVSPTCDQREDDRSTNWTSKT